MHCPYSNSLRQMLSPILQMRKWMLKVRQLKYTEECAMGDPKTEEAFRKRD